jgi:hypothetical protein
VARLFIRWRPAEDPVWPVCCGGARSARSS